MEIKPLAGLTKWLGILLELSIAASVAMGVWSVFEYRKLMQMEPEADPMAGDLATSDFVLLAIAPALVAIWITTGVIFLRWIHRANKNLRTLSGEAMEFTPGWSIGWYFIPIANLWKPYHAMKEIWRVCHRGDEARERDGLLGCWWTLWIVSNMLSRVSFKLEMKAETVAEELTATWVSMADDGLGIVLCIVALSLVKRIAAAYEKNFAGVTSAPPPLPPAAG